MLVDFVGNNEALNELENNIKLNDISHAYLFLGNEGVGKFTAAKSLAERILCEDNVCRRCESVDSFFHPDLTIIRSNGEFIKKEDIDNLIIDASKRPFIGKYKVFIIDGFEKVTPSAQNALLKTLEEPEDYLKIILLSNNSGKILPTILSRVRIIKFTNVSENEIIRFLIKEKNIGVNNASLFAKISQGSVKRALGYAMDPSNLVFRDKAFMLFDGLINGTSSSPFREYAFFEENKDNINEILSIFLMFLRDISINQLGISDDRIFNFDKLNLIKKQGISAQKAAVISEEIINTIERLEKNMNFQITIEQLLIKIGGVV